MTRLAVSLFLIPTVFFTKEKHVLGIRAKYSFARQRHESLRLPVDERLSATMSHKKQQQGVRSLQGFAGQAQRSAADMVAYAVANERLIKCGAFPGWRCSRHSVHNVCAALIRCFFFSPSPPLMPVPVSRFNGEALLTGALCHIACLSDSCSARC